MIDQPTIDRILDAAQIVDIVSDFVTLRKRGVNYVGLCPFHDDKTPSFYVSPSKGLCKCFSCGKGGNAVHFIMEHEQMSYPEAPKYLAKKYGIEIKERELSSEEKLMQSERESLFIVNNFARDYFQNILKNHVDGRSIGMAYFRNRGFRDDIIEKFQLGYCTESHDAMAQEAIKKGFKKEYLVKTGLCYETDDRRLRDRFWGRVIFPVHTLSGKVVAFGGRVLSSATKGVKVKYVKDRKSNPVNTDFDFNAKDPANSGPYRILNKQKQTGVYVQDQAQWDKVLVTLGGRYDWADQESLNRVAGTTDKRDDKQFTWRGGVNYLFDNGVTPYFSYSESFEPSSQVGKDGNIFAPSKGKQYEVGVKYVPEDRPIVVTGAVYNLTKTNNLMADPEGSFFSVEGGEIRARGVEIEAKAALSASVNVVGSYTYTDAEYTTDTTYKGNTPAQVPKHMASLWADYTFFDGPLSGLTLGTGGRYTGSSYGDPANSFKVGSYTVVDALVRYDLARVGMAGSNVALHVNNLFDREYVASCFNTYGCFWGAERQVDATATFRF